MRRIRTLSRLLTAATFFTLVTGCSKGELWDALHLGGKLAFDTLKQAHQNDHDLY